MTNIERARDEALAEGDHGLDKKQSNNQLKVGGMGELVMGCNWVEVCQKGVFLLF